MINEHKNNLNLLLRELGASSSTEQEYAVALLQRHLLDIEDIASESASDTLREINIKTSGDVIVATSHKIQNLKFQLGELLQEVAGTAVAIPSSIEHPIRLVVIVLRFLYKVRKLSKVDITTSEAEVLLAIYKLVQQREILTVDRVSEFVRDKLTGEQLSKSLETLDKLACITLTMDGIKLNETIVISRQDSVQR